MSDTNAKIRGKGLEHTGVTEDHANQMYDRVGTHYVGWVDLKVVRRSDDDDGKRNVELTIESIELASADIDAEHIRRMMRVVHQNRGLAVNGGAQLPLEGTDEPTIDQVRAEREALDPEASEAKEAALADKEAADEPAEPAADELPEDPWDEGPPATKVSSPFDVPDPEPQPAA